MCYINKSKGRISERFALIAGTELLIITLLCFRKYHRSWLSFIARNVHWILLLTRLQQTNSLGVFRFVIFPCQSILTADRIYYDCRSNNTVRLNWISVAFFKHSITLGYIQYCKNLCFCCTVMIFSFKAVLENTTQDNVRHLFQNHLLKDSSEPYIVVNSEQTSFETRRKLTKNYADLLVNQVKYNDSKMV